MTLIAITPTDLREDRSQLVRDGALTAGSLRIISKRITSYDNATTTSTYDAPMRKSMRRVWRFCSRDHRQISKDLSSKIDDLRWHGSTESLDDRESIAAQFSFPLESPFVAEDTSASSIHFWYGSPTVS